MSYYNKYIKYKTKYLDLQNMIGGRINCNDKILFNNVIGSCWNIAILTIFIFGDKTSEIVQANLSKSLDEMFLLEKFPVDSPLLNFLPQSMFFSYNYKKIKNFISIVKKRFENKEKEQELKKEFKQIQDINTLPTVTKKILLRQNSAKCEYNLTKSFFSLIYNKEHEVDGGGDEYDSFFFILLLGIYLFNNIITIKEFDEDSILENILGVKIDLDQHSSCFYECNNELKYYNDNNKIVYNFDWKLFLQQIKIIKSKKIYYKMYIAITDESKEFISNFELNPNFPFILLGRVMDEDMSPVLFNILNPNKSTINNINITNDRDSIHYINDMIQNNYNKFMEINNFTCLYENTLSAIDYKIANMEYYIKYYNNTNKDNDFTDFMTFLTSINHNIDSMMIDGNTILIFSIENSLFNIVPFLIKENADVNKMNKITESPLLQAINKYIKIDKKIQRFNKREQTPFVISEIEKETFNKMNFEKIILLLLEKGADPNFTHYNESLLYIMVESNNYYLTKLLLEHGANPNIKMNDDNILQIAKMKDNSEIIKILLEYGAILD